jgi:excisionase family DNA binding protein
VPGSLLSVREVAEALGVSTPLVYRLCASGALAHVRVSNAIRVSRADLTEFIRQQRELR